MALNYNLTQFSTGFLPNLGDPVEWYYLIENTGDVGITSVQIVSGLGITYSPFLDGEFNFGDTNQNNIFEPGETFIYSGTYITTQQNVDDRYILEEAIVTVSGAGTTITKLANSSISLDSEQPGIVGVQTAIPASVGAGTSAIFITSFENTGNVMFAGTFSPTSTIGITTSIKKAGGYNIGDIDSDGIFDINETWQFITTYDVTQTDFDNNGSVDGSADGSLTNTVTTTAYISGEGSSSNATGVATASVFLDSSNPKTFALIPDASFRANDQYLVIDPSTQNSIHIRAGGDINTSSANIILGGTSNNVSVSDTSKSVLLNSNNRIGFKTSGDYTIAGRGEIFVDHGNNISYNVYAGVGIVSSGIATVNFIDNSGYQFSTLKCFTQVRNNTGETEAFDYIIVSNNSVAIGQTFNRVATGINTLVSVGCTINNNIVNMTLQNISTGPVSFVSHVIGIRSSTDAPTF